MDKELKQLNNQVNALYTDDIAMRIKNNVLLKIEADKKSDTPVSDRKSKRSFSRNIILISAVVIALFTIVFSTAFISPTMAKVVSKIPYLGKLFIQKPLITSVSEELEKNGYKTDGIGITFQPKKEINIAIVGSNQYYDGIKDEVEAKVKDILQKNNYDTYSVKVSKARKTSIKISNTDLKRLEEDEKVNIAVNTEIKKLNVNVITTSVISYTDDQPYVEIEVPNTTLESKIEELKNAISLAIKQTKLNYNVKIKKVNMVKREQDGRWANNLSLIGDTIMSKKEYKVKGIGYSVYPKIELFIRTSVKSTDKDAIEFGNKLAMVIDEFLKSEEMKSKVKDDVYKINILSKDKKQLNK